MQSWPRSKDPNDIRYYGFDWSKWMTGERTAIVTSTFLTANSSVLLDEEAIAGPITTFRVQGGVAGEVARITNRVTFDNGEQVDETNALRIREN